MANEIQQYGQTGVEVVPAAVGSGGTTLVRIPDDPMAVLDARNRMMERVLSYAIAATHPGQWQMLGDKPWPTGPACEAMARRCGVSWDRPECERRDTSDETGPSYTWTYRSRFFLPGGIDSIWAEGHCSSRDQFLGTGSGKKDLSEVEEGNIRQAAMTNMIVNGVTRLLGVRNLTAERLDALLGGGATEKMGKVEYKAGAHGGGSQKSSDDVELKFGRCKGKHLSEVSDDDVRYYVAMWEKDLADPEKEKFHKFCKKNLEVAHALLASRANAATGVTIGAAGSHAPTILDRIRALPEAKGVAEKDLFTEIKESTGKAKASELVEEDIAKVQAVLKSRAAGGSDIGF